jgi:hypothetical protein
MLERVESQYKQDRKTSNNFQRMLETAGKIDKLKKHAETAVRIGLGRKYKMSIYQISTSSDRSFEIEIINGEISDVEIKNI